MAILCACGCGGEILLTKWHLNGSNKIPKYKTGHNNKGGGEGHWKWNGGITKDKEYQSARMAEWRNNNRKRVYETNKKYVENNRTEILNKLRIKYKENPDIIKAKSRKWRRNNPDKTKRLDVRRWYAFITGEKGSLCPDEIVEMKLKSLELNRTIKKEKQND